MLNFGNPICLNITFWNNMINIGIPIKKKIAFLLLLKTVVCRNTYNDLANIGSFRLLTNEKIYFKQ
jgi:hypothetical protein